jgi:hypothetical protein
MRPLLLVSALFFATAFLLAGCLQIGKPTKTIDLPVLVPWTAPEQAQYSLLDRHNRKELGKGTLAIVNKSGQYELSLKFQSGQDYDNSTVLVDSKTLKPISVHRDRSVDGKEKQIKATYSSTENVVTITEIKTNGERPVPHRLKANYYDNDSSLFLWRAIPFVDGYEAAYYTVVTGSGEQQLVHIGVRRKERITVPAGTFDTWRLEIQAEGVKQVVWYADTPTHPLVQYDNSLQFFQATSLGPRS